MLVYAKAVTAAKVLQRVKDMLHVLYLRVISTTAAFTGAATACGSVHILSFCELLRVHAFSLHNAAHTLHCMHELLLGRLFFQPLLFTVIFPLQLNVKVTNPMAKIRSQEDE